MLDSRIPFVPKVLQLNQITFDHKNEIDVKVLNISNYFLRKEDHSCEDALIITVPDGQQPIQVYFCNTVNKNNTYLWS